MRWDSGNADKLPLMFKRATMILEDPALQKMDYSKQIKDITYKLRPDLKPQPKKKQAEMSGNLKAEMRDLLRFKKRDDDVLNKESKYLE